MLVTRAPRWTPTGCSLLFVGIVLCSLFGALEVVSSDVAETSGGKLKIEGGWSEVKEGWPMGAEDYFLATEKGHHFVESQDLPANLKYDLQVTFEYYYSYSKTKPVLQMTPCTENVFLIEDDSSEDGSKKWRNHTHRVDRKKCIKRNEIAYNILLHDPGDVFAWKVLKIESIIPLADTTPAQTTDAPATTTTTTTTTTLAPTIAAKTNKPITPKDDIVDLIDEETELATESTRRPKTLQETLRLLAEAKRRAESHAKLSTQETTTYVPATPDETTEIGPAEAMIPVTQPLESTKDIGRKQSPTNYEMIKDYLTSRRTYPGSPGEEKIVPPKTLEPSPEGNPSPNVETEEVLKQSKDTRRNEPKGAASPAGEEKTSVDKRPNLDDDQIDASLNQRRRRKRAVLGELDADIEGELVNAICVPSSCNKHQFKMARFSALVRGLPKRKRKAQPSKYFVNLKNKPLTMKVESHEESLAEVDTCVGFLLYMEAGTELELLLADAGPPGADDQRDRLLELIKRKAGDSTAGRWEDFHRCISDYMPEYKPKKLINNGKVDEDNTLRLILRPKGAQQPGQVAVLVPDQEASYLARLYRKQSFLPDIKRIGGTDDFKRYWVVDRDGLARAQVTQTTALATATPTSNGGSNEKVLQIVNIDPKQESFDLTSRWLQIRDAETLELPIQFVYRAEQAEWIERVDFQFQRSSAAVDEWISQVAYRAPSAPGDRLLAGPVEAPTKTPVEQQPTINPNQTTPSGSKANNDTRSTTIELPIELKGLDSSEFRLRLRHYLKRTTSDKHSVGQTTLSNPADISNSRTLTIKSLAFADACSYGRPFCRNNGKCKPTGPAQAECICPQGHSGRFCEHVRPCEVLYTAGDGKQLTGDELCRSVGARCVDQLPVMRCEWPNDRFYQCKKLFRLDASGQGYTQINQTPHSGSSNPVLPNTGAEGGSPSSDRQTGSEKPAEQYAAADDDDETQLRQKLEKSQDVVNQQAQLIIILGVFILAILIFALVLVGSMVSRLRRSSKRLKKSQGEVHELSRRAIHPGGFGGSMSRPGGASSSASGPPRPGGSGFNRNKSGGGGGSTPTVGYNNSAFDVES